MHILFKSWIDSFKIFIPTNFKIILLSTGQRFWTTVKKLFLYFKWLIVADVIILSLVGNRLISILASDSQKLNGFAILIQFATNLIWFVLAAATLLFAVMPQNEASPFEYFKQMFLRYIQLSFFFMLLFLILTSLLFSMGIVTLPKIPWIVYAIARHFEVLTIFYWFQSSFTLKNIFGSVEHAANFMLYQLPLIVFSVLLMWAFNRFVGLLFSHSVGIENLVLLITNGTMANENATVATNIPMLSIISFKYLKFLFETIWLCLFFVLFEQKKNEVFSSECFE